MWTQEEDDGRMFGVMMVDLSSAFDMVDHSLLLDKLRLFGLEEEGILWFKSYLTGRTQSVLIDDCLSPPLEIECGVPHGSLLGPLIYIIFTNDIPDLVHDHAVSFLNPEPACVPCGSTVCCVDDRTFSVGHTDPSFLTQKLSDQYGMIADCMAAIKLVINGDKTHLDVMGTKQTAAHRDDVKLEAGPHTILPSTTEKLLGSQRSQILSGISTSWRMTSLWSSR